MIDATGAVAAIEDAIVQASHGGTVLLFGVAPDNVQARFSPFRVYNKELRIIGSMAIRHSFERALLLMARGVINGDLLLTHPVQARLLRRGTGDLPPRRRPEAHRRPLTCLTARLSGPARPRA